MMSTKNFFTERARLQLTLLDVTALRAKHISLEISSGLSLLSQPDALTESANDLLPTQRSTLGVRFIASQSYGRFFKAQATCIFDVNHHGHARHIVMCPYDEHRPMAVTRSHAIPRFFDPREHGRGDTHSPNVLISG